MKPGTFLAVQWTHAEVTVDPHRVWCVRYKIAANLHQRQVDRLKLRHDQAALGGSPGQNRWAVGPRWRN